MGSELCNNQWGQSQLNYIPRRDRWRLEGEKIGDRPRFGVECDRHGALMEPSLWEISLMPRRPRLQLAGVPLPTHPTRQ